ncbi:MAG: hypothetical protein NTW75_14800 [Planctomycetales bacterium]|jgi:hypothetical protein|nr:hypothetical protein [Planctomycetales bacterium]
MPNTTPEKISTPQGVEQPKARHASEADEARIIEAWKSGNYRTKERCLESLGLENINNAALWKRVKRAMDRDDRRGATL